ncbi:MAG: VWA domain-containing protein [Caldilineaceae bacterium]|nr:VWA domain-containing protein [Caldilineaceae bacterium]
MTFIWPSMLFSLLLIPLLVALYLRMQARRRQLATRYGTLGFVQDAGRPLGRRRHLPSLLLLTGLMLLLISLARPQAVVGLPRLEGTVILAFDVSGSMAADDLAPTRMEAAKAAALEFVQRQPPTVRIGVVSFSDSGFAVQPPTDDQEAIFAAINRLDPERGTSLAHGILASLNTIFDEPEDPADVDEEAATAQRPIHQSAVIVLLTDGENTAPPDPFEAAQAAADYGIRIYPIGIGSAEGAILQIEGFTVHSRLDEESLRLIAELTGGVYYNAANEEDLRTVYENLSPQLVVRSQEMEITSIFAGVSILFLAISGLFSLLWFSRLH